MSPNFGSHKVDCLSQLWQISGLNVSSELIAILPYQFSDHDNKNDSIHATSQALFIYDTHILSIFSSHRLGDLTQRDQPKITRLVSTRVKPWTSSRTSSSDFNRLIVKLVYYVITFHISTVA